MNSPAHPRTNSPKAISILRCAVLAVVTMLLASMMILVSGTDADARERGPSTKAAVTSDPLDPDLVLDGGDDPDSDLESTWEEFREMTYCLNPGPTDRWTIHRFYFNMDRSTLLHSSGAHASGEECNPATYVNLDRTIRRSQANRNGRRLPYKVLIDWCHQDGTSTVRFGTSDDIRPNDPPIHCAYGSFRSREGKLRVHTDLTDTRTLEIDVSCAPTGGVTAAAYVTLDGQRVLMAQARLFLRHEPGSETSCGQTYRYPPVYANEHVIDPECWSGGSYVTSDENPDCAHPCETLTPFGTAYNGCLCSVLGNQVVQQHNDAERTRAAREYDDALTSWQDQSPEYQAWLITWQQWSSNRAKQIAFWTNNDALQPDDVDALIDEFDETEPAQPNWPGMPQQIDFAPDLVDWHPLSDCAVCDVLFWDYLYAVERAQVQADADADDAYLNCVENGGQPVQSSGWCHANPMHPSCVPTAGIPGDPSGPAATPDDGPDPDPMYAPDTQITATYNGVSVGSWVWQGDGCWAPLNIAPFEVDELDPPSLPGPICEP